MLNFSEITQINIPEGEVIKIEIDAITVWEKPTVWDYIITPLDGSEEGYLPVTQVYVNKGDVLTIEYYLTRQQGYIYDARNIETGKYYGSVSSTKYPMAASEVGVVSTKTLTAASTGYVMISGYYARQSEVGQIASSTKDPCYGYYIKVKIN